MSFATLLGLAGAAPATWDLLWTGPLRLLLCPGLHGRPWEKVDSAMGKWMKMVSTIVSHGKKSPAEIWIAANEH